LQQNDSKVQKNSKKQLCLIIRSQGHKIPAKPYWAYVSCCDLVGHREVTKGHKSHI